MRGSTTRGYRAREHETTSYPPGVRERTEELRKMLGRTRSTEPTTLGQEGRDNESEVDIPDVATLPPCRENRLSSIG